LHEQSKPSIQRRPGDVVTCQKCGKENQDHYKFCLGCGSELEKPRAVSIAEAGGQDVALRGDALRGDALRGESGHAKDSLIVAQVTCPQCNHTNGQGSRFCASCGYKLNLASVPRREAERSDAPGPAGRVILTALRADGTEAGQFELPSGPSVTIGRDTGSVFAGDTYLSPTHAVFSRKLEEILVSDVGSLNGIYIRIPQHSAWPLRFGDMFRIGQEILRLDKLERVRPTPDGVQRLGSPAPNAVARLGLVIGRDTTGNAFLLPRSGLHLGRERGDVLFPEDGYVSGLHCKLTVNGDDSVVLTDLGSSNGSFVRLRDEYALARGDVLLMGQQLFRVDL
jgi:pSer/pThr/pTyr-binding forkhead associated (FHA) protein